MFWLEIGLAVAAAACAALSLKKQPSTTYTDVGVLLLALDVVIYICQHNS